MTRLDCQRMAFHAFLNRVLGTTFFHSTTPTTARSWGSPRETHARHLSPLYFWINLYQLAGYIDDYAGIWTHGQQALNDFLTFLNDQHPNLSFTMEHSGQGQGVPFLDTFVTVETCENLTKLETELYIKPTNSGIILHSTSAHPKDTKYNIIRNIIHRAYNNSPNKQKEDNSVNKIWKLLLENGYPSKLLKRLLGEVGKTDDIDAQLQELSNRFQGKKSKGKW